MLTFRLWLTENTDIKKLIVMRGFPGSGKSSLAQKLGQGGVVFSTDDFFMQDGKYNFDQSKVGEYHQLNLIRTQKAMEQGVSPIVVDNTNTIADHIRPYANIARKYGYEIEFREPQTPWKSDVDELTRRNSHGVPRDVIQKMVNQWQNLTPDQV